MKTGCRAKEMFDGLCIEEQAPGWERRMGEILNRDCGRMVNTLSPSPHTVSSRQSRNVSFMGGGGVKEFIFFCFWVFWVFQKKFFEF